MHNYNASHDDISIIQYPSFVGGSVMHPNTGKYSNS